MASSPPSSSSSSVTECPVCFDDPSVPPVTIVDCGHGVCGPCLIQLRATTKACPICRGSLEHITVAIEARRTALEQATDAQRAADVAFTAYLADERAKRLEHQRRGEARARQEWAAQAKAARRLEQLSADADEARRRVERLALDEASVQQRLRRLAREETRLQQQAVEMRREGPPKALVGTVRATDDARIAAPRLCSFDDLVHKASVSTTLAFSFTWTRTRAPEMCTFSSSTLDAAFHHTLNVAKEQYVLSVVLESMSSTAPYPLHFTLAGICGKRLERVYSANDCDGVTETLLPNTTCSVERSIYRMSSAAAERLCRRPSVDMRDDMARLVRPLNQSVYMVPASTLIGKTLAAHLTTLQEIDPDITYLIASKMYMVNEKTITSIVEAVWGDQDSADGTTLVNLTGEVTRADRTREAGWGRAFGDASDVPGLSTHGVQRAHDVLQQASVVIRLTVVNQSMLRAGNK